jgi:crotonobetaine/carnitine-CoA ligase
MPSVSAQLFTHKNCVISNVLSHQAKHRPDSPALQWEGERPLTYKELYDSCLRLGGGLQNLGVEKGDKVLIMLPNSLEIVMSWLSINLLGGVEVPINIHYKGNFLTHEANGCQARVAIVHEDYLDRFVDVSQHLQHLTDIILVGKNDQTLVGLKMGWKIHPWEKVAGYHSIITPAEVNYYDTAAIMYTSGTTGPSKGVEMPYALAWVFAQAIIDIADLIKNDVYYVCLPLFHANAQFMQVLPAFMVGARVSLWPRFSATQWLNQVRACGGTVTNTLGVMSEFIYRQPVRDTDGENPLRAIFALPTPKDIAVDFERRFAVKCLEGYGMTECSVFTYRRLDEPLRLGSAGRPLEWFEVQIVDPLTDEPKAANQVGEIVVRPKLPGTFMKGYHRLPEKTVEAWRNLWFHTGDAGRMDEDGYLYFVDRLKDAIRRRGENISSQSIEIVINAHPLVKECAAISLKSEHGAGAEDEIKVCVILKDGATLDPLDLHEYCERNMPYFAVPRFIEFISFLPKTANEKIRKIVLRETGINPHTWDREMAGIHLNRT